MKHILKKTLEQNDLSKVTGKPEKMTQELLEKMSLAKDTSLEDTHILAYHKNGVVIRAFHYTHKSELCMVPLVNPILLYYNESYSSFVKWKSSKIELQPYLTESKLYKETSLKIFYDFFGAMCSCIQLLLNSMEAFINWKIPDNYIYKFKKREYDKEKIQRWISFEDKIKIILSRISHKDFSIDFPNEYQRLMDLKKLRDTIVHTKQLNVYGEYQRIFEVLITYDLVKSMTDVKNFINYFEVDLIEECPCDKDY